MYFKQKDLDSHEYARWKRKKEMEGVRTEMPWWRHVTPPQWRKGSAKRSTDHLQIVLKKEKHTTCEASKTATPSSSNFRQSSKHQRLLLCKLTQSKPMALCPQLQSTNGTSAITLYHFLLLHGIWSNWLGPSV